MKLIFAKKKSLKYRLVEAVYTVDVEEPAELAKLMEDDLEQTLIICRPKDLLKLMAKAKKNK